MVRQVDGIMPESSFVIEENLATVPLCGLRTIHCHPCGSTIIDLDRSLQEQVRRCIERSCTSVQTL